MDKLTRGLQGCPRREVDIAEDQVWHVGSADGLIFLQPHPLTAEQGCKMRGSHDES